ncbi:MAG: DUF4325 domain-containing protein [Candidatus Omnitrophota bacterium]
MDIKLKIVDILQEKGQVKSSDIIKLTGFSRSYVNRFFQELRNEGKILLVGKANTARYILATKEALEKVREEIQFVHSILINEGLLEDIIFDRIKKENGIFLDLSDNVSKILNYAFTEMLNNAIEHSCSAKVEIAMKKEGGKIVFKVIDKGMGIFNNIMKKKELKEELEAIQSLLKGKLSTDEAHHSGEGIFFTSKVADMLIIQSSQKKILFNNIIDEVFIEDVKNTNGTKIFFTINCNSQRELENIFKEYTDDSYEFSKTEVIVKLYKEGVEYISRSQARRILSGIDKFKTIILDFKDVETVGQGFADEIFRIWKLRYPNIEIIYQNANENIDFMIKRAE